MSVNDVATAGTKTDNMTVMLTRDQAQAAAAAAVAERDAVQANLLDLDGSFGKRLLAGATLTGESQKQWATASAGLAALWGTFTAYSAVIDRAAEILAPGGRLPAAKLEEASALLTGASVRLARAVRPLRQRELTAGAEIGVTLTAAVGEMRRGFSDVAAVLTAAESVWEQISDGLQQVTADLVQARQQLTGIGDSELTTALTGAEAGLRQLRDAVNSDPLALWQCGQVRTDSLERLRQQAAEVTARAGELARLRDEADRRIAEVGAAVTAAQAAWQDATSARERAATRVSVAAASPLPDISGLIRRVDSLAEAATAGRWTWLESELDLLGKQAAAVTRQCREAERFAVGVLGRRDELRGLLDAYRAKAARFGAVEDAGLHQRYQQARDLLWTAPCDLAAATAAVTSYQQAVLSLGQPKERS
jgi:hypothetical protein